VVSDLAGAGQTPGVAPALRCICPAVDLSLPEGWVGIAHDSRTLHHWCSVPDRRIPACAGCRRWLTDWTLINPCTGARP
jgi:hypothetical protein